MSQDTFDIVVAGGGTCALVLASRLATADPSLSILVVEAGPPTRDDPMHVQPVHYPYHLRPDTTTVKYHVGRESPALGGRAPLVPIGQCVGGSSSINFTMYTRAAASDYDDWATVHGNSGWSSTDLLPFLRKSETYQIAPGLPTHGYSGPLKVSYGSGLMPVAKDFLNVAAQYDKTRGRIDDPNALYEINKFGQWQKWIDAETGTRSDVAHHYFYNKDFKNIKLVTGYYVKRVIVKDGRATGIEYVPNKSFRPNDSQEVLTATARKLVVVSGGSLSSPAILERSGIGAKAVLDKVGVKQVVDLPGVGENHHDHQVVFAPYVIAEDVDTLDGVVKGDEAELKKWLAQWEKTRDGLIAHNGLDAGGKLRPSEAELAVIGDDFRKRWLEYYANAPDKAVMWFGLIAVFLGDRGDIPGTKSSCVPWYLEHPESVGFLHVTSGEDPAAPLDFHPGYLDCPSDMALHKWGYKMSREFGRRMASYRGEIVGAHPAFSENSQAAAKLRDGPVPISAPNLEYTAEDEKAIEEWIRKTVQTTWHSLGTCAMKSREKGGVVDSRLNVYGVQGLKVVDMSIAPSNVAANTYSTALVIAEKAAILVAEDLGIPVDRV